MEGADAVTCEEARGLLPGLAEEASGGTEPLRRHLGSCSRCSAELAGYRAMLLGLGTLREETAEPPNGMLGRILSRLPRERRPLIRRLGADRRVRRAALPLAALVGAAAAAGMLHRRRARRGLLAGAAGESFARP